MKTILYIKEEHCESIECLRSYFTEELTPESCTYTNLVDYGRNGSISKWLQEKGELELSESVAKIDIDSRLPNSEYFLKLKEAITGESGNLDMKPSFGKCFMIKPIKHNLDSQGVLHIIVSIKVLYCVNENYGLKVTTKWGSRGCIINTNSLEEGNNKDYEFTLRKPISGDKFEEIKLFVDGEEITDIKQGKSESEDKNNGHEYVDLGLSVKWATCNVGASSPEDYGDYFAWGETKTKSEYNSDNSVTFGKNISDIKGNVRYDAARANWGGTWRLPTETEFEELKNECTWRWTTQNGKNGYKVTGPNGNSIFLPAAGYRLGSSLYGAGEDGYYWSSTPGESGSYGACYRYFGSDGRDVGWGDRDYGRSVRPVSE